MSAIFLHNGRYGPYDIVSLKRSGRLKCVIKKKCSCFLRILEKIEMFFIKLLFNTLLYLR